MRAKDRTATVAVAVALLAVSGATDASAARAPTSTERIALSQAAFDYYLSNPFLGKVRITGIRISTVLRKPSAVGSRLATKYALIATRGYSRSGQDVGGQAALAVYFTSPNPGWHIYVSGTADIGCEDRFYPIGMRPAILRDLRITDCPS